MNYKELPETTKVPQEPQETTGNYKELPESTKVPQEPQETTYWGQGVFQGHKEELHNPSHLSGAVACSLSTHVYEIFNLTH